MCALNMRSLCDITLSKSDSVDEYCTRFEIAQAIYQKLINDLCK